MLQIKVSTIFCIFVTLSLSVSVSFLTYSPCVKKDFGHGSVVCVCNATYCDEFTDEVELMNNQYVVYTSTKDGQRFNESLHTFGENKPIDQVDLKLLINASVHYQTILGFGGAFTGRYFINFINDLLQMKIAKDHRLFATGY